MWRRGGGNRTTRPGVRGCNTCLCAVESPLRMGLRIFSHKKYPLANAGILIQKIEFDMAFGFFLRKKLGVVPPLFGWLFLGDHNIVKKKHKFSKAVDFQPILKRRKCLEQMIVIHIYLFIFLICIRIKHNNNKSVQSLKKTIQH